MKSYYALHYLNVTFEDIMIDPVAEVSRPKSIPSLRLRLVSILNHIF